RLARFFRPVSRSAPIPFDWFTDETAREMRRPDGGRAMTTMTETFAHASTAPTTSRGALWTGRVLSGLATLFLTVDAIGKLAKVQPVIDGTVELGYPESVIVPLGVVLLASVVLYAIPATAVLGAILLTGYL